MRTLVALLACAAAGCACSARPGADASIDATPAPDAGSTRIVDLATAGGNNCVVLRGGRAVCWGSALPIGASELTGNVDQVAVGPTEVCVRRGSAVECRGAPRAPSNPLLDPPADELVDIGANSDRACGRAADGRLVCWGLGALEVLVSPVDELRVGALGGVCVRAGAEGSCWFGGESAVHRLPGAVAKVAPPNLWGRCGLDASGAVVCDPTCVFEDTAPDVCPSEHWETAVGTGPGGTFVQLELPAQQSFACGLRVGGELACWGIDYDGRPGGPEPTLRELEPSGARFRDIGVGEAHVCGITVDDRVVCWGRGSGAVAVPEELR